jgi:hypothetical protein
MYLANVVFVLIAFLIQNSTTTVILLIVGSLALILAQIPIYMFNHKLQDLEVENGQLIPEEFANPSKSKEHIN